MAEICSVSKEVYVPSPEPHVAASVSMSYVGRGLRREETRSLVRSSDWRDTVRRRVSEDNGRSWSDWELVYEEAPVQGEYTQSGGASQRGTGVYDPVSGRLVKPVFQRVVRGDPRAAMKAIWSGERRFADHGFYQLSADDGRTWGAAEQLKYEDGPDFDPDNWGNPDFFRTNEMYIGRGTAVSDGSLVISATVPVSREDEADESGPSVFPNNYREGCVAGAMCFVGRWAEAQGTYVWTPSNAVSLPRRVSTRGLVELDICELRTGRLLLVMRGSNVGLDPVQCPGRKWFSVSDDGGMSWTDVEDVRYDTGEPFHSPASIHKLVRSARTGRLYWMGNITSTPADGNRPRYPLQIVEVDEERVCFKKDTVTVVDDRDPTCDAEEVQLSNFTVLENRETQDLEVYLTRLGERGGGAETWSADAYRYTLAL